MAHLPRFISKQISRFWSEEKLYKSSAPVFLPFYHVVSNNPLPHILNYPHLNEKEFENQLDYFLKYFNPISLEDLYNNPNPNKKVFHLSFDDGLRECLEVVAPILLRKGIPATFFFNSGFVDNKTLFHRYKASLILSRILNSPNNHAEKVLLENGLTKENILKTSFAQQNILDEVAELLKLDFTDFLKKEKPYLSTDEIVTLHKNGFSIGGHSHNHPEFWKISEKEQLNQVQKSMNWISEHINPKIKTFAFPFTDDGVSTSFIQKLKQENICDLSFGTAGLKIDSASNHLQRVPMEIKGYNDARQILRSEYCYYHLKSLVGKNYLDRK